MESVSYLPKDVLEDILVRLPVKCLLRFRAVSKSWNSLLRDSCFVARHLEFDEREATSSSGNNSSKNVFLSNSEAFSLLSGENLDHHELLDFPFRERLFLVNHCNGIICGHISESYFLWNPALKEYKVLPESCIPRPYGAEIDDYISGFGFDAEGDDYKVVRFAHVYAICGDADDSCKVEIYSLKSDSWREIEAPSFLHSVSSNYLWQHDRYLSSGFVFWTAEGGKYKRETDSYEHMILLFDMTREAFRTIALPSSAGPVITDSFAVTAFNESIALIIEPRPEITDDEWSFWVLNDITDTGLGDSSWVMLFTLAPDFVPRGVKSVLGFSTGGELLFSNNEDQLEWYCPVTEDVRSLQLSGDFWQFTSYRESLVSIGGDHVLNIVPDPCFFFNLNKNVEDEAGCWMGYGARPNY